MDKKFKILLFAFVLAGFLFFLFVGLVKGKAFLIPLSTAIILSMVMNPVAKKFIQWGIGRGWAIFFSDLIIVAVIAMMVLLLAAQANQVANNWPEIEKKMKPKIEKVQNFFNEKLNMPTGNRQGSGKPSGNQNQQADSKESQSKNGNTGQSASQEQSGQQQQQHGKEQQAPSDQQKSSSTGGQTMQPGNLQSMMAGVVKNIFDFISNLLLMLVYIFFFMYYQKKFKDAIIGLAPAERRAKAGEVLDQSAKIAQQYLFGRFILIAILAVLYIVGYSAIGLKYAIFISLLAALFSLIPYVGNVVGLILAILASSISDGGSGQIIAIIVIFSVIQFIESYALEPFVVGGKVDLNPVIVIVGVVLGGLVWGIMGMILAIPVLGIIKVIFDNTESLKPLGYVLDEKDISSGNGWTEKAGDWFKKKFRSGKK